MREANVVGFMPSNSAAPPGPETLPFVRLSAVASGSRQASKAVIAVVAVCVPDRSGSDGPSSFMV